MVSREDIGRRRRFVIKRVESKVRALAREFAQRLGDPAFLRDGLSGARQGISDGVDEAGRDVGETRAVVTYYSTTRSDILATFLVACY